MRGCVFVDQRRVVDEMGQVVGLLGEALAGRERLEAAGRAAVTAGRARAARAYERPRGRLAGAAGRTARERCRADVQDRGREGARRGLARGQIARQVAAAEVRLRRRAEPLRDLDAPCLAGRVQAHDGFQRRRDQVGERAADGDVGQRRQVAPDRRDHVRKERDRAIGLLGRRRRVEPGLGLQVREAGVQRGVDLGGIAPGVDADALAGERARRVVRARVERLRVDDVGGRGLGALIERRVERVVGRRGDDPQRAPPRRQAERAREIVAGVRDRPHRQRARLQRRQVNLHQRAARTTPDFFSRRMRSIAAATSPAASAGARPRGLMFEITSRSASVAPAAG